MLSGVSVEPGLDTSWTPANDGFINCWGWGKILAIGYWWVWDLGEILSRWHLF